MSLCSAPVWIAMLYVATSISEQSSAEAATAYSRNPDYVHLESFKRAPLPALIPVNANAAPSLGARWVAHPPNGGPRQRST